MQTVCDWSGSNSFDILIYIVFKNIMKKVNLEKKIADSNQIVKKLPSMQKVNATPTSVLQPVKWCMFIIIMD